MAKEMRYGDKNILKSPAIGYCVDMQRVFDGEALARARKAIGINLRQADLAGLVLRNRVTISDIERGRLIPGEELAQALANAVGVDVDSLYRSAPDPGSPYAELPGDIRLVAEAMEAMDPVARAKVLVYAHDMATDHPASSASEPEASAAERGGAARKTVEGAAEEPLQSVERPPRGRQRRPGA